MTTWQPLGGIAENPGVWDNGNGATVYVDKRADGVVRRRIVDRVGRDQDATIYTCDKRDQGGCFVPAGVVRYDTAARAKRGA